MIATPGRRSLEDAGDGRLERDQGATVVARSLRSLVLGCCRVVLLHRARGRDHVVERGVDAPGASEAEAPTCRHTDLVRIQVLALDRSVGDGRRVVVAA